MRYLLSFTLSKCSSYEVNALCSWCMRWTHSWWNLSWFGVSAALLWKHASACLTQPYSVSYIPQWASHCFSFNKLVLVCIYIVIRKKSIEIKMVGTLPFIVGNTNDHDKCHRCTVLISRGIQIKGTKRSPGKLKMGAMNQVYASIIYFCNGFFEIFVTDVLSVVFLLMVEKSSTEDAKVPLWFHVECFVKQFRHADESKIQNFATLSNTDKATIQRHMSKPYIVIPH